jgi:PAS domain S-box-containing protein
MTSKPPMPELPDWTAIAESLGDDPALRPFVREGAILLWSLDGQKLLHANGVGRELIGYQQHAATPAGERLRLLGKGLAPRNGVRLERLRLLPGTAGTLLTCACRRVSDSAGNEALLTALSASELRRISRGSGPPAREAVVEIASSVETVIRPAVSSPLRFTWESDAHGLVRQVSSAFDSLAGPAAASRLIGKTWDELLATSVIDEQGRLASALSQTETWSGCSVIWQLTDPNRGKTVQLSAMPVVSDGAFAGFRGFGLVKAAPDRPFIRQVAVPDVGMSLSPAADNDSAEDAAVLGPAQATQSFPEPPLPARDTIVHLRLPPVSALRTDEIEAAREATKPKLSLVERNAFREIAQALGARIDHEMRQPPAGVPLPVRTIAQEPAKTEPVSPVPAPERLHNAHAELLDRLPIAVMIRRSDRILYANRTLLDLLDYADVDDLNGAGGAERVIASVMGTSAEQVSLVDRHDDHISVDARADDIVWKDEPATLLSFRRVAADVGEKARLEALSLDVAARDTRLAEMAAVLDTATDGVVTVDERGRILSLNKSAEALFGFDQREVTGDLFTLLLAPESHTRALDYLEGLKGGGVASVLNDGREVMGRVRQGGRITLFMTMGQIAQGSSAADNGRKYCAVLRDITAWKKTELELVEARKQAEKASAQKSDVLAKISHEIRTPLNAIIGFSEVMAEERFGPIGNERYREYLRDIHESGGYVISLVNDLLDLAKIEAGRLDLDFVSVNLNEIATSSVALLQPEAQRGRVVLRSGLSPKLPPVVADERSIRQIMINVLSNAVKFTDAGGQVIVSSALGDKGEAIIRVRDTGIGMSEADLKLALEPFRQVPSTRKAGGTGLGLPLTKALVEANRASLAITSAKNEGTLIEITFPPQRVLAS